MVTLGDVLKILVTKGADGGHTWRCTKDTSDQGVDSGYTWRCTKDTSDQGVDSGHTWRCTKDTSDQGGRWWLHLEMY